MPGRMLVYDNRVESGGRPPRIAPNIHTVGPNTQIVHALRWIATYARGNNGLDDLFILAHGRGAYVHDTGAMVSAFVPGFGLIFCRENLTLSNIHLTSELNGLVQVIGLFACGPAHTTPGYRNRSGDGELFCRQLSQYTGAVVVAPEENQFTVLRGPNQEIELLPFRGRLRRFEPTGQCSMIRDPWE
jgi:hypothetical protein